MDRDERARRAALAKKIRNGLIATGAAGALGLTGLVATQGVSSAQPSTNGTGWTFSGDGSSGTQSWQSDDGSWGVRPQGSGGSLSQPHALTGGS